MPKRLLTSEFWRGGIFTEMGFTSASDYFATILGFKVAEFFTLKIISAFLATFIVFLSEWVWQKPLAIGLFIFMNLVNAYFGYQVAKNKGEPFSFKKLKKTLSICISDFILMAMLHNGIKLEPDFLFLGSVLFGLLFGYKFQIITAHMVELGLQSLGVKGIFTIILKHLLRTKLGADYVDEKQQINKDETNTPT